MEKQEQVTRESSAYVSVPETCRCGYQRDTGVGDVVKNLDRHVKNSHYATCVLVREGCRPTGGGMRSAPFGAFQSTF